jgi:hypothetical protein
MGEELGVIVQVGSVGDRTTIEQKVNEDLNAFGVFFTQLGNEELSRYEVAAIKTYLHWKIFGK